MDLPRRPGRPPAARDGALVFVVDADRRPLARGFWDARSPIAVRVLAAPTCGPAAGRRRRRRALDRHGCSGCSWIATNAFRWIHGEADALPGMHVDVYGAAVTVRDDGAGARAFYVGPAAAPRSGSAAARGLACAAVVERGRAAPAGGASRCWAPCPSASSRCARTACGSASTCAHGQKGGLFLDQRDNRALVGTLAGRAPRAQPLRLHGRVLDLRGGGRRRETTTVDVAAPAIEAARRNFERNGLSLDAARLHAEDAFAFLSAPRPPGALGPRDLRPAQLRAQPRALPAALAAYRAFTASWRP